MARQLDPTKKKLTDIQCKSAKPSRDENGGTKPIKLSDGYGSHPWLPVGVPLQSAVLHSEVEDPTDPHSVVSFSVLQFRLSQSKNTGIFGYLILQPSLIELRVGFEVNTFERDEFHLSLHRWKVMNLGDLIRS